MSMFPYFAIAFSTFLVGVSKGGLGGNLGTLITVAMSLVLPVEDVLGLMLPILIACDIFTIALYWKRWEKRLVMLLIPGAVLGVTVGTLAINSVSSEFLRNCLGIIVLLFVGIKMLEPRVIRSIRTRPIGWHGWAAGSLSGFASAVSHAGAPPVSIYLLMQHLTPRTYVATSALFFALLNWIKVPYYLSSNLINIQLLSQFAWILPCAPIGVWVGRWATSRIKQSTFDHIITALLGVSAMVLIIY